MKKYFRQINYYCLIIFVIGTTSCFAQIKTQPNLMVNKSKAIQIHELVNAYYENNGFNGSVLVAHQGELIYKKGFGFANMEWKVPNTPNTKFRIASITKPFTAILVMQLVEKKVLKLDEPIGTYLKKYPTLAGEQITIRHLLTHTSGLVRDVEVEDKSHHSPKELISFFSKKDLQSKPGEKFSYSNAGYILLGYLLETVTGKPYKELLEERIFIPLKMFNSGYYRHHQILENRSSGYRNNFIDYRNVNYKDFSNAYSAGAIYSTVEDMFLFDQALYTEQLVSVEYLNLIFSKHVATDFGGDYGLGWELAASRIGNSAKTVKTVGHSGSLPGYCSVFTRIPSTQSTIIFLNNTQRAYLNTMTTAIMGILYNTAYHSPKKSMVKLLMATMDNKGITECEETYSIIKKDTSFYFREKEINVASYKYLQSNQPKKAEKMLQIGIDYSPKAFNLYDSYGEVLLILGEKEKAIKNYQKSLELNPNNENGIKKLNELGVNYSNDILMSDTSWGKELFVFPLRFAKDIDLKGFEDARFPKGWSNEDSPEFWSYAFGWCVNSIPPLSKKQIEDYVRDYYDGLIASVNKDKDFKIPKTKASLHKNGDGFIGKVNIYDAFVSKKLLSLNLKINQFHCQNGNKSIIVFKVSPSDYKNSIWRVLDKIEPNLNICNN